MAVTKYYIHITRVFNSKLDLDSWNTFVHKRAAADFNCLAKLPYLCISNYHHLWGDYRLDLFEVIDQEVADIQQIMN